jgi:RimJ/RimL family protein N-acetyltransferase
MKNRYLKYFKIVTIDVIVYRIAKENILPFPDLDFDIQTEILPKGSKKYFIKENEVLVHSSSLFNKLNILRLIQKKGPAIGDCFTNPDYRGKSIYPFVINFIAKELLEENRIKEVFIIVNRDNIKSIRGIEKAGFNKFYSIKATRWLYFYFNKNIV